MIVKRFSPELLGTLIEEAGSLGWRAQIGLAEGVREMLG